MDMSYLDILKIMVDSSYPPGAQARKGSAVRRLKRYVSWVNIAQINTKNILIMHLNVYIGAKS